MPRLVVFKKGGGGKVAVNPEMVTYVRSAAGAFTDVFFDGQQVAVEGTFEEIVTLLSLPDRRLAQPPVAASPGAQRGLTFKRRED